MNDNYLRCDACRAPLLDGWHSVHDERLCSECWHAEEMNQPSSAAGVVAVLMFAAAIAAGLVIKFGG